MKSLLLFFLCFPIFLFGQDKTHHNEIGIEVTGLWKQIMGSKTFGQNDYYLTYRRYFDGFNLNSGLGFSYSKVYSDGIVTINEDNSGIKIDRQFNFRVGIERMKPLRKRLTYFYGAFLTQSFMYDYNNRYQVMQGFAIVQTKNIAQIGIAPFWGFRYNFSDRIGIETSSMINFYTEQEKMTQSNRFVGPVGGNPRQAFTMKKSTWRINNQLPIFLLLTVKI